MSGLRTLWCFVLALSGGVCLPGWAGAAQIDGGRLLIEYRTWTLEDDSLETSISQLRVPIAATLHLGATQFVFSTAGAVSEIDAPETNASLEGATDLTIQGFMKVAADRILFHAGVGLPIGRKELNADEMQVAAALAHPVLGFRLKEYGRGLDVSAGAAFTLPLGEGMIAGVGGGFISHGSYALMEEGDDYKPGNEISLSAGIDIGATSDAPAPLRLDAVWRTFEADQIDDREIFEEGDQITLEAVGRSGGEGLKAELLGRGVFQSDNTIVTGAGETVGKLTSPAGTFWLMTGGIDFPLSNRLRLGVGGEWSTFSGSEGGARDGQAFGIGPTVALRVAGHVRLAGQARWLMGALESGEGAADIDVSGIHAGIGLRLSGS
ncbi:MAG: hypothetical protein V1774_05880 [Candidatus Eisenbacteria bacterium]